MRINCEQTILMKYRALFVIFEKISKIWNCRLLQIVGGALCINTSGTAALIIHFWVIRRKMNKQVQLLIWIKITG